MLVTSSTAAPAATKPQFCMSLFPGLAPVATLKSDPVASIDPPVAPEGCGATRF